MFAYNLYRLCLELDIKKEKIHKLLIKKKFLNNNLIALDDRLTIQYKSVTCNDGSIRVKRRLLVDFMTYCSIRSQLIAESQ